MSQIIHGYLISIELFDRCLLDGKTKKEIIAMYPTRKGGAYYLDKFANYLKDYHNISMKEYAKKYLYISWPLCPISRQEVGFKLCGKGIVLSKFQRGKISKKHCPAFNAACVKFSKERSGKGNPMYGRVAWNRGLNRTHPIVNQIASQREGKKFSQITKDRQSQSAKKRAIHGHTGHKHTQLTKDRIKIQTAKGWASGRFNRISSIHLKVREYLASLHLKEKPSEEYQVKYFSMDFAFPTFKIAIECQGTFFHVDPRIYPNGPINAIQRRNFGRDIVKRKICCEQEGWIIIELWETEINDGSFKKFLSCKLSELNLLNQSE